MSIRSTITQQYQDIVDNAAKSAIYNSQPAEGWVRTMRKALGMSGAQLARKIGVTRALISQAENNEISGAVTIKTMQKMAEAMGCRFVYAVLPPMGKETGDVIFAQAMEKARSIVERTDMHMALENQSLPKATVENQIKRLAQKLAIEMASDFWNDRKN